MKTTEYQALTDLVRRAVPLVEAASELCIEHWLCATCPFGAMCVALYPDGGVNGHGCGAAADWLRDAAMALRRGAASTRTQHDCRQMQRRRDDAHHC